MLSATHTICPPPVLVSPGRIGDLHVIRETDVRPVGQVLPVGVEDLHALVQAIGHIDPSISIHIDTVHRVELAITGPVSTPRRDELAVLVEFHDARVREAVGHEHTAVGKERQILRPAEMRLILSGRPLDAQRLQQLLAVVREHVDDVLRFADHPDATLRVVGADLDLVRPVGTFEQGVPLGPHLQHLAGAVHDAEAAAHFVVRGAQRLAEPAEEPRIARGQRTRQP